MWGKKSQLDIILINVNWKILSYLNYSVFTGRVLDLFLRQKSDWQLFSWLQRTTVILEANAVQVITALFYSLVAFFSKLMISYTCTLLHTCQGWPFSLSFKTHLSHSAIYSSDKYLWQLHTRYYFKCRRYSGE